MRSRVLVTILFVCFVKVSLAQQMPRWVGIDNRVASSFAVAQWKDEWCWAASTQLILNYYGIHVTQADIVGRIHGNYEDQPGSDFDISEALEGWVPTVNGVRVVHASEGPGLPDTTTLIEELSQGRPILIAFATGPSSGHAVVITGAAYIQSGGEPNVVSLVLRDPWPSPGNVASIGRVQIDNLNLAQFAGLVRAHWLVSVSDVHSTSESDPGTSSDKDANESCESDYRECVGEIQSQADCMEERIDGCMTSCLNQYGYSYAACQAQFCNPNFGSNTSWAGRCRQKASDALQECKTTRRDCKAS
jgi:Peptidase_C39 like family